MVTPKNKGAKKSHFHRESPDDVKSETVSMDSESLNSKAGVINNKELIEILAGLKSQLANVTAIVEKL